eukprot:TRINITY_DN4507_c0_g1_i14.p1 TRINITY_DN4507_c0_g1~~TRINITY_DN4507_c0_g1_i14.p1  ORF type:complete len:283 (+),score=66.85 TRINITY_DN4507_c0_g1_i14:83-850(+)
MCIRDRYQRRVHGDFIYISHNILFKRGLSEVVGMNQRTKEVKLVIVGQSGVGKSSILLRFVTGDFKEDKTETMGASFLAKSFLYNGRFIKYQIWDTAGQEKYKSLVSMYYKDSKVALIVYDITNKDSFDAMKSWVQELKENGPSNLILAVVGNKIDLEDREQVSWEDAMNYAKEIGAIYGQTSAKENKGIETLFQKISEKLMSDSEFNPAGAPTQTAEPVQLKKNQGGNGKTGGCCQYEKESADVRMSVILFFGC